QQLHACGVQAIHVLEHAALLHHKHFSTQLQYAVQLGTVHRCKWRAAPHQVRQSCSAQARTSLSTKPTRGKCTCKWPTRSSCRSSVLRVEVAARKIPSVDSVPKASAAMVTRLPRAIPCSS